MTETACTVLVVDDEPYLLPTLARLLEKDFRVLTAESADQAEALFETDTIDIILTDQKMPDRGGIELLEWVCAHHPRTVRVLMTGYSELESAVEAINRGQIYHYLRKPWRTEELISVMKNAREKLRLEQERDGLVQDLRALNAELEARVRQRTAELEKANYLLQQQMCKLEMIAQTDALTNLRNRRAITEVGERELSRHERYPSSLAIGIIDVDHFKDVNTQYLLTGGDAVLKSLAKILVSSVRTADTVGRLGGEEFMVIAPQTGSDGAIKLAERIRTTVEETPIIYRNQQIDITVSLGFAVLENGGVVNFDTMHHVASEALHRAKEQGRNRCLFLPVEAPSEAESLQVSDVTT